MNYEFFCAKYIHRWIFSRKTFLFWVGWKFENLKKISYSSLIELMVFGETKMISTDISLWFLKLLSVIFVFSSVKNISLEIFSIKTLVSDEILLKQNEFRHACYLWHRFWQPKTTLGKIFWNFSQISEFEIETLYRCKIKK